MKIEQILKTHLPEEAVSYGLTLYHENSFSFKLSRKRATKLGDYKFDPKTNKHQISVNNNLNTFAFLITYVHEVAHHTTMLRFGRRVKPHGKEWKTEFRRLMLPLLCPEVFPENILQALARHLKNPKASSCNDLVLMKALSEYDEYKGNLLEELPTGTEFLLGKRRFKKEGLRRTRYVCLELSTGKKYLISKSAPVIPNYLGSQTA